MRVWTYRLKIATGASPWIKGGRTYLFPRLWIPAFAGMKEKGERGCIVLKIAAGASPWKKEVRASLLEGDTMFHGHPKFFEVSSCRTGKVLYNFGLLYIQDRMSP
jgi:hypothetical protein